MKTLVKKVYCPFCQKLVAGREEKANGNSRVLCSRCGKPVWVHEGISWRYVGRAP
ncbi:MAG: hypothetical protein V1767_09445 [Chloroflexota bacterium]